MFRRRSAAVLLVAFLAVGVGVPAASAHSPAQALGPNVTVFDPSMPVERDPGRRSTRSTPSRSTTRWARTATRCCSSPASTAPPSEPLQMKVGYYTEVAGLGASPADVTINGKIEVYNRCLADGGTSNCLALVNFWRTLSNLSLQHQRRRARTAAAPPRTSGPSRRPSSMRRVSIAGGNLSLMDYCTAGPQFASGGFIADSTPAVRHQRLAAAVADPQQRDRRLVERGLEPGLRGRRRRA